MFTKPQQQALKTLGLVQWLPALPAASTMETSAEMSPYYGYWLNFPLQEKAVLSELDAQDKTIVILPAADLVQTEAEKSLLSKILQALNRKSYRILVITEKPQQNSLCLHEVVATLKEDAMCFMFGSATTSLQAELQQHLGTRLVVTLSIPSLISDPSLKKQVWQDVRRYTS